MNQLQESAIATRNPSLNEVCPQGLYTCPTKPHALPHQGRAPEEPAPDNDRPSHAPALETETERDEEIKELGIEDAVSRELARALQPRKG